VSLAFFWLLDCAFLSLFTRAERLGGMDGNRRFVDLHGVTGTPRLSDARHIHVDFLIA
jgi:hypothetical protein